MATGTDPLGRHKFGERLNVTHACPECPIFHPRAECTVCRGSGIVTALELAVYVMRQNRGEFT